MENVFKYLLYQKTFFNGKIFCLNMKFGVLVTQETWTKPIKPGMRGFGTHLKRSMF